MPTLSTLFDFSNLPLVPIVLTFLLAGVVKGIVGFGMPLVTVALLTLFLGLPTAMALMIVPAALTNYWQAIAGGGSWSVFKRIWLFLLIVCATIPVGTLALVYVNLTLLSAFLGVIMIIYALISLRGFEMQIAPSYRLHSTTGFGIANGLVTGMTGTSVMPGVIYLRGIGLEGTSLLQAMGMLFGLSVTALGPALSQSGFMTPQLFTLSCLALVPAIGGMQIGQAIRTRLPVPVFRKIFLGALAALGSYILVTSLITA